MAQVENGELTRFYACRECANALNYGAISISSAMESGAKVQPAAAPAEAPDEGADTTCPRCGLSYRAFRESMKFGCADCYEAFAARLPTLLAQVQADTHHVGKIPPRIRSAQDMASAIADLRAKIKQAVGREDFAHAAELRDQVRELERRHDDLLEGRQRPDSAPEARP